VSGEYRVLSTEYRAMQGADSEVTDAPRSTPHAQRFTSPPLTTHHSPLTPPTYSMISVA
jgi:hypothetical protein